MLLFLYTFHSNLTVNLEVIKSPNQDHLQVRQGYFAPNFRKSI
ncbi:hypothetical protein CAMSH0001_1742 [Campylobacter showae RM3277]|uniref:Uncharacterized protein n=1 Tax=Campylobacter showae RM3277 TaxID=553219 RepID=C6RD26_9BACT|nr:hypothetical protein CAMSH0001_1742 [Campylobacter showae RM3277]